MLIWIGVMLTLLVVTSLLLSYFVYLLCDIVRSHANTLKETYEKQNAVQRDYTKTLETALNDACEISEERTADFKKAIETVFGDFLKSFEFGTKSIIRSQDDLAANIATLLREIKISKTMAEGTLEMAGRMVGGLDYLEKVINAVKSGPRNATVTAPTDEQAADWERGDRAQEEAIMAGIRNGTLRQGDGLE